MQRSAAKHRSVSDLARAVLSILRRRFSLSTWRPRAKHRRELWALYGAEDRILKDVGVTREDVMERIRRSETDL
ncbi:MAG: hypothetical protein AAF965_07800 [Pseudomonadota bacterium]